MKKYKTLFIILLIIDLVVLSLGGIFVYKKGGINYALSKFNNDNINAKNIQRQSLFSDLSIASKDIVFLGDSITQRCEWNELFNNVNIKNRGIDGDTTEDILNRLDSIIQGQPQKIFIMIGVNDLSKGKSISSIVNNYEKILQKIKDNSSQTRVYIESVLPVQKSYNIDNKKIKELNSDLKDLSAKYNYTYINVFDKLADESGYLKKDLSKDGIHLMSQGYKIWKDVIKDEVKS